MINLSEGENSQKKALFIDASREMARVALIVGDDVIRSVEWLIGFGAGKEVLGKVDKILEESGFGLSDIDRIAAHVGPAKRSSILRAGVTVATFLAYSSGAELVAVNEDNEADIAHRVFAAIPESVIKPNYDRPGFGDDEKKA